VIETIEVLHFDFWPAGGAFLQDSCKTVPMWSPNPTMLDADV